MGRRAEPYSVIERPSGYWYYKLADWRNYRSTGIEIKRNSKGKALNEREAWEFAREEWERHKLDRGGVQPTLREMLAPYFVWGECPHIARVSNDRGAYTQDYAHWQRRRLEKYVLNDPIADKTAIEVTPGDIEDWKQRRRAAGIGLRTLNMTLSAISTAYKEEIHRNPKRFAYDPTISVSAVSHESQRFGIYTLEEVRAMFADPNVWGYNRKHPGMPGYTEAHHFGYAFALAHFQLGERPSALLRLDWCDREGDRLTLSKAKTKTHHERTIPLPAQLQDALDELRDHSIRIAPDDPIFCYDDGTRRSHDWFEKRWRHMMRTLGLPGRDSDGRKRTPYSLKRSLITHLIDVGEDEVLIREWVGHSHSHGEQRVLTPTQARYKERQAERLERLRPAVEKLL